MKPFEAPVYERNAHSRNITMSPTKWAKFQNELRIGNTTGLSIIVKETKELFMFIPAIYCRDLVYEEKTVNSERYLLIDLRPALQAMREGKAF